MPNNKKMNNIIDEILDYASEQSTSRIVENKGSHIINGASNLLKLIEENYGEDVAYEVEKKMVLAIKNRNDRKFKNKIRSIFEGKRNI